MIKIAVCDDNKEFLKNAIELIQKWSDISEIPIKTFAFNNGDELIEKADDNDFDIIFLDIIMPLINGMDTAKELRQRNNSIKIVFLTSSPEFALESYEVRATDYLLKPVTFERIKKVLDECSVEFKKEPENIIVKTTFGFQKIYFYNIEYAEAQNKKVIFYLKKGEMVESTDPLYSFEDKLTNSNGFFKCHRSYLVYLPNIDHFSTTEITTKSGRNIPIARGYAKAFKEAYFSLMFCE